MAFTHSYSGSGDRVDVVDATGSSRLFAAVATVLGVEMSELSDDSSPESVEAWDSLNHLNIAMAVESEFSVALSAQQVMEMGSIRLIRAALREQGVDI